MTTPTDLEIVTACAKAMDAPLMGSNAPIWNPLADDAQAMALVKRFKLRTMFNIFGNWWTVKDDVHNDGSPSVSGMADDLNRAICLCVFRLMEGKR